MMSGKPMHVRAMAVAAGMSLLGIAPASAQTAAENPPTTPAQALTQLQELPSVADLADRLLPAVVEITIEAGNGAPSEAGGTTPESPGGDQAQPSPDDPNNPFKDFFEDFLRRAPARSRSSA